MADEPKIVGQTIQFGSQTWQFINNKWFVQIWGWQPPYMGGSPGWSWLEVAENRVPSELKALLRRHT